MGIFNCKSKSYGKEQFSNAQCFSGKRKIKDTIQNKNLLCNLDINTQAIIIGYDKTIDAKTKRRMLELGFVNGKKVVLLQKSILGEVILVEINGYLLSLRVEIAKHIQVKQIESKENI